MNPEHLSEYLVAGIYLVSIVFSIILQLWKKEPIFYYF